MLQNEVICVRLYQSKWGARKSDKEVSKDTQDRYGADRDAGSFNKKLAPAKFLSGVNGAFESLERFHKEATVAWDDDGWRLLGNDEYFDYMAGMDERKAEISRQVDLISASWPEFLENESGRLGKMFKTMDYPNWDEVSELYGARIKRKVLQTENDIRIASHSKIEDAVREEIMEENRENEERAMKDLWNRLYEPIQKLAEKMQEPELKGNKTLVTNIYDIVEVLPRLNVFGNAEFEIMYKEVEDKLCQHSVKKLKLDEDAHAETRQAVDEIMKKMEGYV